MTRAIEITTEGQIFEVDIIGNALSIFEVLRPSTLSDRTTDLDGRAVLLTFPQGDDALAPNLEASKLVWPASFRARHWLVGPVFVVGEDPTGIIDFPERLGAEDIREFIAYEDKR